MRVTYSTIEKVQFQQADHADHGEKSNHDVDQSKGLVSVMTLGQDGTRAFQSVQRLVVQGDGLEPRERR